MKIKVQITVDKYIAKPLAFLLNFFVRIVGKCLNINHDLDKDFDTIAISKFKGMGSILQSTPMLNAIRNQFPKAEIIYISTKTNESILKKIEWIDTVVVIDDSSLIKFIITNVKSLFFLIKKKPQVYFDLEIYSDYSTLFTLFTLSTNRVGFYLRSSSFRMGIYTHMMFFNPRVPISKVYLQLSKLIGCETNNDNLYPLKSECNFSKTTKDYIVVNPNASDLRIERRWGKVNFINLINKLLYKYTEVEILLIGSANESAYTEEISSKINNSRVKNIAGKTDIDELISIISNAKLFITNDTGPMHIAFCTNVNTICLFGPCSPDQYGISKKANIIYKPVYCSPCVHDFEIAPCKGNNICMQLITVDEVFNQVMKLEKEIHTTTDTIKKNEFLYKINDTVLGKVMR